MIVFAVVAVLAGTNSAIVGKAHAGVVSKVTVNSRGNTDDGTCEGPPNDSIIGGDCTLEEAINAANAGTADVINFHPAVFPVSNPGVISLDLRRSDGAPLSGDGCLPAITRSGITINSENAGVIIDGDVDGPISVEPLSPITCTGAIQVDASENGFNFTILGGKGLKIQDINGDGINIGGDDNPPCAQQATVQGNCGLGTITIDGVHINNVTGDGIVIDRVREARHVTITGSDIKASYQDFNTGGSGNAVDIEVDKCSGSADPANPNWCVFDRDQMIQINNNQELIGDHKGVQVETTGDIGNPTTGAVAKITVQVNGNDFINALPGGGADEAVNLQHDGCIAKSAINYQVNDNTRITSARHNTVDMDVNAGQNSINDCQVLGRQTDGPDGSDFAHITIDINGNGNIRNDGDRGSGGNNGISIDDHTCCGQSQSQSAININNNGNIIGEENGILIRAQICCADNNISTIGIAGNGEITGRGDEGIDIDSNYAGETRSGSAAVNQDADGNTAETTIENNDRITGNDDDGIYVDNEAGVIHGDGTGDDNVSHVTISGNRRTDGESSGFDVYSWALSDCGKASHNTATITTNNNEQVAGFNSDGAYLDAEAGSLSFFNPGCTREVSDSQQGDDNVTDITVDGNDRFVGGSGDGLDIFNFAGGDTKGSERNTTNLSVTNNGSIEGENTGYDGIYVETYVCCASRKTNVDNILIDHNSKIIGHDGNGINIDGLCCSTAHYVTSITNNGRIVGGAPPDTDGDNTEGNGIRYTIALGHDNPGKGDPGTPDVGLSEDLKQDGIFNTISNLMISGNLIEDSGSDGIYVCCGPFENADQDVKSSIDNNIITTNLDHGIEIDSSFGLNIKHNEIFKNGDDSQLDAGIEINNKASEFDMTDNGSSCCLNVVPADHNRITDNSIYDNRGLGIDLATDIDGKTTPESPNRGEYAVDHGVGCDPKAFSINPNDCIGSPVFKTKQVGAMLGTACALCTVEIFQADDDPADNTKANPHHGEGVGSNVVPNHYYLATGQADADGNFMITLPCGLGAMSLTATATDKVKNTSEFSKNISMLGTAACGTATFTPTNTPLPVTPTNTPLPVTPVPTTAVPTHTNTPTPVTPTPIIKACGDVNDNGSVDAVDAQLVLQFKAGLIQSLPNLPSADVNHSGEVTSVDAALILQVSAGLIPLGSLHCS